MTSLEACLFWFIFMITMLVSYFFIYEPRRIDREYKERMAKCEE